MRVELMTGGRRLCRCERALTRSWDRFVRLTALPHLDRVDDHRTVRDVLRPSLVPRILRQRKVAHRRYTRHTRQHPGLTSVAQE